MLGFGPLGKMLILLGVFIILIGIFLLIGDRIPWLGRLPEILSFEKRILPFIFPSLPPF